MSFVKKGASAFGKLFIVVALAGAFTVGAVGVVYMSLQGEEMKVPEIVGKDLVESEKELASLGLRIKKRADRYSTEKPNTILEQLPKAGDTVKTGQMILVVTSKTNPEGEEAPATLKKNTNTEEENASEKIEELISDKPKKKANTNANANKKKNETTRDVIGNNSNGNSNSNSSGNGNNSNSNKSNSNSGGNKNASTNSNKSNSNSTRPAANKAATGVDVRPRRVPQP